MTVELKGGPLEGVIHEVNGNFLPYMIGLPDEELGKESSLRHWYKIDDEYEGGEITATYHRSGRLPTD